MQWPAYSPDLNPIENIWVYFGRQIRGADSSPTVVEELEEALVRVWMAMTIDFWQRWDMFQIYRDTILCPDISGTCPSVTKTLSKPAQA